MTTAPLTEASEQLLTAVRGATRQATVDRDAIQTALDTFATTAGDSATDSDFQAIHAAAWEIAARHKQGYDYRGKDTAARMAAQYMWKLSAALEHLAHPFDGADALASGEQELAQRERAATAALTELENAVQAGDVDAVMRLRGEVEVKHPRRIAEARTAVLELRIEQARARQAGTADRAARGRRLVSDAEQRLAELHRQVQQAEEDVTLAKLEQGADSQAAGTAASKVQQMEAEMTELTTSHEAEMQARLRRIAGLPEPEQPREPESTEVRILGATSRADANDFSPSTVGSY